MRGAPGSLVESGSRPFIKRGTRERVGETSDIVAPRREVTGNPVAHAGAPDCDGIMLTESGRGPPCCFGSGSLRNQRVTGAASFSGKGGFSLGQAVRVRAALRSKRILSLGERHERSFDPPRRRPRLSGRLGGIFRRHADLQMRLEAGEGGRQGPDRPQSCVRLHQVLEARRRAVRADRRGIQGRRQRAREWRQAACDRQFGHHPAPCLQGVRRAYVWPHRESEARLLRA